MTKTEVTAVEKFGPYLDVKSTGGAETFNGWFDGKKANISFHFDDKGLRRIQVWAYEGQSINDAGKAWASLYTFLKNTYGQVEVPQIKVSPKSDPMTLESLTVTAIAHVGILGKVQMAPEKMPENFKIFSSFAGNEVKGKPYYYVLLYFDRP